MAATTAAIIGITATAASTAMSFAQAAKQQRNIRSAEAKAAQAMEEARKKLEVNVYDQLSIQKEPYELQREAALVQGAQAIQAGQEADRGAAATAGRIQMAQNEAQAGIRTAMGKELTDIERMQAMEEGRLRDINVQLDMGEIAGAQQAQADAERARAQSMAQGFQGVASIAQQSANFFPLYMQSGASKALGQSEAAYNKAFQENKLPAQYIKDGKPIPYQEAAALALNNPNLGTMTTPFFEDYMIGKGKNYIQGIDWMNIQGGGMTQSQKATAPVNNSMNYFDFISNPFNPEPNNAWWITNNQ